MGGLRQSYSEPTLPNRSLLQGHMPANLVRAVVYLGNSLSYGPLLGFLKGLPKGFYRVSIRVLTILGGSWDLVSKVISPLIGVISNYK